MRISVLCLSEHFVLNAVVYYLANDSVSRRGNTALIPNPRDITQVCPNVKEKEYYVVNKSSDNALLNTAEKIILDEVNRIQNGSEYSPVAGFCGTSNYIYGNSGVLERISANM